MKNLKTVLWICLVVISLQAIAQPFYYVSNRVLNAVNIYNYEGEYISEFIAQDSGGLSNPQDMVLHPDLFFLVTGTNNPQIKKYDMNTGAYLGEWSDPNFDLERPSKMSIGPDNLLYVTQWGTTSQGSKVVRFDLEGNYLGPFTPSAPQGLGHVWDGDGNFYLALFGLNPGSGTIRKYDSDGNFLEIFINSVQLENPTYIWWETPGGNMLVQDFTAGKVLRYDNDGNYIDEFITGLTNPEGYSFSIDNDVLISDRGSNQVLAYNQEGQLVGQWNNGGLLASPNFIIKRDYNFGIDDQRFSAILVTPTTGSEFHINTLLANEYKTMEVYNIIGKLVATINPQIDQHWNGSGQSEGLYFIMGTRFDNSKGFQKIIIQK